MNIWLKLGVLLLMGWWSLGCLPVAESPTESPEPTIALQFITPTFTPATPTPTSTATPSPTVTPTPTTTPSPTPTPTITPTPNLTPHAIINSPSGSLNIRNGPGSVYNPPLGVYENGAVVDVLGRQYDSKRDLWWLIPFAGGQNGQGWIYAGLTSSANVDNLPWITAPPTPTPSPVPTPQPPVAIINSPDGFLQVKRGPGAFYDPPWGAYNNGALVNIIGKQYSAEGELWWLIPFEISPVGQGWVYAKYTLPQNVAAVPWVNLPTAVPGQLLIPTPIYINQPTPPIYGTPPPIYEPLPATPMYNTPPPVYDPSPATPFFGVEWAVAGRVVNSISGQPLANIPLEVQLGQSNLRQRATTNTNGEFSLLGSAPNEGDLIIKIAASGYTEKILTAGPVNPRTYYFEKIELNPLNCLYENLLELPQDWAMARLHTLGFTNINLQAVSLAGKPAMRNHVMTQSPQPPADVQQSTPLKCDAPIILGIGAE